MKLLSFLFAIVLPILIPTLQAEELGAAKAFGSAEALAIVEQAEKVVAYRIESDPLSFRKTGEYKIVGNPVSLSEKTARNLITTMTDPKLYDWDVAKACLPRPGVLFRFLRRDGAVDMLVCLECDIFFLIDHKGKRVGGGNCDAASTKLLDLAVTLFPKDAGFREMKDYRDAEAEKQRKLKSLRSPTDGAKLVLVVSFGEFELLTSPTDGSIWLHSESKGLYKPDPNDKELQNGIAIAMKNHQEREGQNATPAE